eukprot:687824-Amphidinium_carterae.1
MENDRLQNDRWATVAKLGAQVAFAKGEAIRLGLNEKEEILPSFREARQKVEEHKVGHAPA